MKAANPALPICGGKLDVIGEVIDTLHQAGVGGLAPSERWKLQRALLEKLAQMWREPDSGIWEIRSEPQQFI
jgi:hypothetical protein